MDTSIDNAKVEATAYDELLPIDLNELETICNDLIQESMKWTQSNQTSEDHSMLIEDDESMWITRHIHVSNTRRLIKFHQEKFLPLMDNLLMLPLRMVDNLRSAVSRNGLLCVKEAIHVAEPTTLSSCADTIVSTLIMRCTSEKQFIRQVCTDALKALIVRLELSTALACMAKYSSHKHPRIAATAANCTATAITNGVATTNSESHTLATVLVLTAVFINGRLPETREHGRSVVKILVEHYGAKTIHFLILKVLCKPSQALTAKTLLRLVPTLAKNTKYAQSTANAIPKQLGSDSSMLVQEKSKLSLRDQIRAAKRASALQKKHSAFQMKVPADQKQNSCEIDTSQSFRTIAVDLKDNKNTFKSKPSPKSTPMSPRHVLAPQLPPPVSCDEANQTTQSSGMISASSSAYSSPRKRRLSTTSPHASKFRAQESSNSHVVTVTTTTFVAEKAPKSRELKHLNSANIIAATPIGAKRRPRTRLNVRELNEVSSLEPL